MKSLPVSRRATRNEREIYSPYQLIRRYTNDTTLEQRRAHLSTWKTKTSSIKLKTYLSIIFLWFDVLFGSGASYNERDDLRYSCVLVLGNSWQRWLFGPGKSRKRLQNLDKITYVKPRARRLIRAWYKQHTIYVTYANDIRYKHICPFVFTHQLRIIGDVCQSEVSDRVVRGHSKVSCYYY